MRLGEAHETYPHNQADCISLYHYIINYNDWWGIFHGTERNGNGTQVPEVNVCIHTLAKLLDTHHYKYNSTSTKQEIDQTPSPVVLARSSLACYWLP